MRGAKDHAGEGPSERQRLDKWLWHARVVKTRSDAASLVAAGRVRVNGSRETSPGHGIKRGDILTVTLDRTIRVLEIADFAERRGDAPSTRHLLIEHDAAAKPG